MELSGREFVVLGTASQVPTRERAHHAALLRFDGTGILLDPGEGTQRQLLLAGISMATIHRVCITHAHGDHCLGLPGVLQRAALDEVPHPLDVHYPHAADPYIRRLRHASAYQERAEVRLHPTGPGSVSTDLPLHITAAELSHGIPTLGWRFSQPPGVSFDTRRLRAAGVHGPARTELAHHGKVTVDGRTVHLEDVSRPRAGISVGFVMDTRRCEGALELAEQVDLLVIEATFLDSERELAEEAGHLTAAQAARIGADAGARKVLLTHFSQRYPDTARHLAQARAAAPGLDIEVARELTAVSLRRPRR